MARGDPSSQLMEVDDVEILKLPFPVTVIEYRMGSQSRSSSGIHDPLWGSVGDKRITLLVDIPAKGEVDVANVRRSCFAEAIDPDMWAMLDAAGGIIAFALWFDEIEQTWSIGIGALVVPRNQSLHNLSYERMQELQKEMNQSSLNQQTDVKIIHAYVPCLMGMYAHLSRQHGHESVQASMRNDVLSDACVATDFLRAYHCKNVQTQTVFTSGLDKLNKRRQSAGKLPFFVYRILVEKNILSNRPSSDAPLPLGVIERDENGTRIFVKNGAMGLATA